MNNLNTLSSGAESVAQHLDVINQLCDELISTFSPSREQVTDYTDSVSMSLSLQNFLITDDTLRTINQLDRHLGQLYDIVTEEKLMSDHHDIRTTIQEKIDLIVQLLLHDNYFHMTYGRRMTELITELQQSQMNWLIAA